MITGMEVDLMWAFFGGLVALIGASLLLYRRVEASALPVVRDAPKSVTAPGSDDRFFEVAGVKYATACEAFAAAKPGDAIWLGDQALTSLDLSYLAQQEAKDAPPEPPVVE